tara:strand:- start:906 stop:1010 length:105 start_codon:yes stop_codon:yes gene_type:complete
MITNILLGLILLDLLFITLMVYAIGEKVNEKEKD